MSQNKSLKRERGDESQDPCKKEKLLKMDECKPEDSSRNGHIDFEEILKLIDKDGGLSNVSAVDQVLRVMHKVEKDCLAKSCGKMSQRGFLSGIIVATKDEKCLSSFLELGCVFVLDEWLRDAHEGRLKDGQGSIDGGEKGLDELILTLLGALSKLQIDLDSLEGCTVGKSVSNLLSHTNPEIQKKARNLVDTWEKHLDMADGDEPKQRFVPMSGKQLLDEGSKIVCFFPDEEERLAQSMLLPKESSIVGDISRDSTRDAGEERDHALSQSPNGNLDSSLLTEGDESRRDDANCIRKGPILEPPTGVLNDLVGGKQISEVRTSICSDVQKLDIQDKEIVYPCTVENGEHAPSELQMDHDGGENSSAAGNLDRIKSNLEAENAVIGRDTHPLPSDAACEGCENKRCGLSKSLVVESISSLHETNAEGVEDIGSLHELNAEGDIKDVKSFPEDLGEHSGISTSLKGKTDEDVMRVSSECAFEDMLEKTEVFPARENSDEKSTHHDEQGCNESERGSVNKILSSFHVKDEELMDEYEEEDALEIARWVAKEVEQEVGSRSPSSPQISDKNEKTLIAFEYNPEASPTKEIESVSVTNSVCGVKVAETLLGSETMQKTETRITLMACSLVSENSLMVTSTCGSQANQVGVPVVSPSASSLKTEVMETDSVTAPVCVPEEPVKTPLHSEDTEGRVFMIDSKAGSPIAEESTKITSRSGCQSNEKLVPLVAAEILMETEDIDDNEAMAAPMIGSPLKKDSLIVYAACGGEANELSVPVLSASVVDNDKNASSALSRPIFDLNEGFASDDVVDEDPSLSTITIVNAHVSSPINAVAIVDGFIPPPDLVRSTENIGRKGSASRSAFKQAEPLQACKPSSIATVEEACKPSPTTMGNGKCGPPQTSTGLEAHKCFPRDPAEAAYESAPTGTTKACVLPPMEATGEACESPLTRTIHEAGELPLTSTSKEATESFSVTTNEEACQPPPTAFPKRWIGADDRKRVKNLDIDLNVADDISLEEDARCSKNRECNSFFNVGRVEFDLNMVEQNEELATVVNSGSTEPVVRMVRDFDLNDGPGVENYSTQQDCNPPSAIPLGARSYIVDYAAASHSLNNLHSMVTFSGSGGDGESSYFVQPPRKMTSLLYPPSNSYNAVSPFENLGRVIDVPRSDLSSSWSRPSLDLNAGPDTTIDIDSPCKWQISSSFPFQQGASSSGGLKRKEPDGGFNPFHSGLKHMVGPPGLFPPSS